MKRFLPWVPAAFLVLAPATLLFAITTFGSVALAAQASCGPGGTGGQVGDVAVDAEQLAWARTIVETTANVGMGQRAAAIAVATAMQESSLRNITHGDRDSVGLFQQRPSQGWGTVAKILDPAYATNKFLAGLRQIDGWESMPLTVAAQAVQRSAFPDAYAKYEQLGTDLAQRFWPAAMPTDPNQGPTLPPAPGDTPTTPTSPDAGWATQCSGGDGLTGGGEGIPAVWTAPTDGQQAAVVAFALDQVGEPYVWGGTGPDGWDCSGLTMKAWASVGVALPRTTYDQVKAGAPVVNIAAAQPGDLLFIAGSDGTAAAPGHMGMYIGEGYLVHAPRTGADVTVKPVTEWGGLIVAIRRPGGSGGNTAGAGA